MVVDYRLGSSADERSRLLAQCDLFRACGVDLLAQINLPRGSRALDVGCGPLGILDLLSAKVTAEGSVVGLDTDERMVGWARESIADIGLTNVSVIHAALPPPSVAQPTYDLVHCRLVLVNNARPGELLAAMVAATRPGGWFAAQEVDWSTWRCDPPHPAWDELKSHLAPVFGGEVHIGGRLPAMLAAAGLKNVRATPQVFEWSRGDRYQTLILHFAALFGERMLHSGQITPGRLRLLTTELDEHLHRRGTTVRESLLVQAWGQKPTEANA